MFEVGDILISKFGYNCTLVNFYKILSITPSGKSVRLAKIGSKIVDDDGYGQAGHMMPMDEIEKIVGTRKIGKTFMEYDYVKIEHHRYAYKWDGNKVWFDSYD